MLILGTFYPPLNFSINPLQFICLSKYAWAPLWIIIQTSEKLNQSMPCHKLHVSVWAAVIPSALCHLGHIPASAGWGHHSFTAEPKPNSWHPKAAELYPRTVLSISLSPVSFQLPARPSPSRGEPPWLYVNDEHSGKHWHILEICINLMSCAEVPGWIRFSGWSLNPDIMFNQMGLAFNGVFDLLLPAGCSASSWKQRVVLPLWWVERKVGVSKQGGCAMHRHMPL